MKLAAVVPAAGLSLRMGQEKLLLPFRGSTVLESVLATLQAAGVEERVVVVRPDFEEARERSLRAGARLVINPHPEGEMLVSIRLGISGLSREVEAFFVWPADHPAVQLETVRALAREASPDHVVVPTYRSLRGHPALVGQNLRPDIEGIPPQKGLRHLWRVRPDVLRELPVEDRGVLLNLDTPEQYEKAIRQL